MSNNKNNPFLLLYGRELSSVEFVRDYIQLRFDGPRITIITDPVVESSNDKYARTNPNFCNMLCNFIGYPIEAVSLDQENVTLIFPNAQNIKVFLHSETGESLIFDDGNGETWIW